jgi:DNA-binding NtrC family response regulator
MNTMSGAKILVVDDEDSLRTTLAANLELEGYQVVEARSGEEALSVLQQQKFDLVLTDIRMPGMNGVELFKQLRAIPLQTPVVMMTGFAVEELVAHALEGGAFTVLLKPFDVGHALKVVSNATRVPTVLIIDDVAPLSASIVASLAECGVRAKAVPTADAAVDAVRSGGIDVCIVDMVMPQQNGPEVIERLRAIDPSVMAIVMSGYDVPELVQKVTALGIQTFLQKPFRVQDLVRAIALSRGAVRAA